MFQHIARFIFLPRYIGRAAPRDCSRFVIGSNGNFNPFLRHPPQINYPSSTVSAKGGLDVQNAQGGISLVAPLNLAIKDQRLPPMLNSTTRTSIPDCSKASRGLFVLPRVSRIFTTYVISPSPWLRQFSDR